MVEQGVFFFFFLNEVKTKQNQKAPWRRASRASSRGCLSFSSSVMIMIMNDGYDILHMNLSLRTDSSSTGRVLGGETHTTESNKQ